MMVVCRINKYGKNQESLKNCKWLVHKVQILYTIVFALTSNCLYSTLGDENW